WTANFGIYKFDGAAFQFFTTTPERLGPLIAGAGCWFDAPIGGGNGALVFYSGNTGAVYLLNTATKVWTPVPNALPGQRGQYHNVCAYSKQFNCLVYGGGNMFAGGNPIDRQVWRMNADLTTKRLPDAPHSVGI